MWVLYKSCIMVRDFMALDYKLGKIKEMGKLSSYFLARWVKMWGVLMICGFRVMNNLSIA